MRSYHNDLVVVLRLENFQLLELEQLNIIFTTGSILIPTGEKEDGEKVELFGGSKKVVMILISK